MHLALTLLGGIILLGVCMLFGQLWGANAPSIALAAKVFIPIWLVMAVVNMWVGVNLAGYSVREELPILAVVALVPAIVAILAVWYLSRP